MLDLKALSGSFQFWEYLGQLSPYLLLKKDSSSHSPLISHSSNGILKYVVVMTRIVVVVRFTAKAVGFSVLEIVQTGSRPFQALTQWVPGPLSSG